MTHPQGFSGGRPPAVSFSHVYQDTEKMFAIQFSATQFYIVCRFSLRQARSVHSKLEMYALGREGSHLPGRVGGTHGSC